MRMLRGYIAEQHGIVVPIDTVEPFEPFRGVGRARGKGATHGLHRELRLDNARAALQERIVGSHELAAHA